MHLTQTTALALLVAATALPATAQESTSARPNPTAPAAPAPRPASEQVIVPQVDRREVTPPRFASNDISLGAFVGRYATANFGGSAVAGLRLGYHITEDVFVETSYARAKVSDDAFRQIFPNGGIFPTPQQDLSYYNVVAGYNLLPGEVFFGRNNAKISQGYVVAGVGNTTFASQKRQTLTVGFGLRVKFAQWFAAQADVRNHSYSIDLLGKRQNTQNTEITVGATAYF
jgi:outer membrane beta-barrel protein